MEINYLPIINIIRFNKVLIINYLLMLFGILKLLSSSIPCTNNSDYNILYKILTAFLLGLCDVSLRETVSLALHIPEEEQNEESDGFLQLLHVRQVPQ